MVNSIDLKKEFFLHVIPFGIIISYTEVKFVQGVTWKGVLGSLLLNIYFNGLFSLAEFTEICNCGEPRSYNFIINIAEHATIMN